MFRTHHHGLLDHSGNVSDPYDWINDNPEITQFLDGWTFTNHHHSENVSDSFDWVNGYSEITQFPEHVVFLNGHLVVIIQEMSVIRLIGLMIIRKLHNFRSTLFFLDGHLVVIIQEM
jgi:hypothetical protein